MINIDIIKKVPADLSDDTIQALISDSLKKLNSSQNDNLEIEVIFTDKEEIQELNSKYRNKNQPTDVLSFPQTQFEGIEKNIFGSIVICPEVVKEKEETTTEVIKHSILHLLGYDHETNIEEWNSAANIIDCHY